MRPYLYPLLLYVIILAACIPKEQPSADVDKTSIGLNQRLAEDDDVIITFGSCNKQDSEQILWDDIIQESSDMWIWLGDNIYGDSEDPAVLLEKYELQLQNQEYQTLLRSTPIVGTWDDHDYGKNNAGKELASKQVSRDLLFQFLDVAKTNPAWRREGAYIDHNLEKNGIKIKVVLLDSRYFRDAVPANHNSSKRSEGADILGEAQWAWLDSILSLNAADVHLIANGIQFIAEEHKYEKWSNFPMARKRLFDMLREKNVNRPILMSGDRHLSELSALQLEGIKLPLYDITSSGLTHHYRNFTGEKNQHRIGKVVASKSYGVLVFNQTGKDSIQIELRFMGDGGKIFQTFQLFPA